MSLKDKQTVVMGLARTGVACVRFLVKQGAKVTATDLRSETALDQLLTELNGLGIHWVLGHHNEADFVNADLVIVSPGVPMEHPMLVKAMEAGVEIVSEIELASRFITVPMVAITGTNGKTTTTTIAGEIFKECGFSTYIGGNIGDPLIELVASGNTVTRVVAEISSFQLEWITTFKPKVAALLNISEDHLDRYLTYQDYINAKLRIFENQDKDDFAVVNRDDTIVWESAQNLKAQLFPFSRKQELETGIFCITDAIIYRYNGNEEYFPVADFCLTGVHNLENIMAALACTLLLGASPAIALKTVQNFESLHHRMEFVRKFKGVAYYEDSKATNVGSVEKALESFHEITLIAGGKDKGGSYAPLVPMIQERVRHLILIGEAADRMQTELGALTDTHRAATLEEAVWVASKITEINGTVLMSPACSSFDMFKDYEERAQRYIAAVKKL